MNGAPQNAAQAFARRLDVALRNEQDVARDEHRKTFLRIVTAPVTIALLAAAIAAVVLVLFLPRFVQSNEGDVSALKLTGWSLAVGLGTFFGPGLVKLVGPRVFPKRPSKPSETQNMADGRHGRLERLERPESYERYDGLDEGGASTDGGGMY